VVVHFIIAFIDAVGMQLAEYPMRSLNVAPGPGTPYASAFAVCRPYAVVNVLAELVIVSYLSRAKRLLASTLPWVANLLLLGL
jgi:hypothetical protein